MVVPSVLTVLVGLVGLVAACLVLVGTLSGGRVGTRTATAPDSPQSPPTPRGAHGTPDVGEDDEVDGEEPRRTRRLAVVVNPSKFDEPQLIREHVGRVCEGQGWAEPVWIETTVEDPGTGQAHEALRQGVDLVCSLGGDGTVRAVAEALAGQDVPLGLLPGGTGNLLARNLDLPVDSLEDALRVALGGRDRRIDVARLSVHGTEETDRRPKNHLFLVMAGLGFDAEVMASMNEELKAKVGWAAYILSGLKNISGSRFGVSLSFDGGPLSHRRVRSVMLGNCGKVQLGVALLPQAVVDDGRLDAMVISPKGIVGWASVVLAVITKNHRGHPRLESRRFTRATVRLDRPQELQLDGDPIGRARQVDVSVDPGGLIVRVG